MVTVATEFLNVVHGLLGVRKICMFNACFVACRYVDDDFGMYNKTAIFFARACQKHRQVETCQKRRIELLRDVPALFCAFKRIALPYVMAGPILRLWVVIACGTCVADPNLSAIC